MAKKTFDKNEVAEMYKAYKKEIENNEALLKKESGAKSDTEICNEYVEFVKQNNCKLKEVKSGRTKAKPNNK